MIMTEIISIKVKFSILMVVVLYYFYLKKITSVILSKNQITKIEDFFIRAAKSTKSE